MDDVGSQSYNFIMRKGSKKNPEAARTKRATTRFTDREWNRVIMLARIYAGGDLALWIRHGSLNAERKYLK